MQARFFFGKSHGERSHLHLMYNMWYLFWLNSSRRRKKLLHNLIRWQDGASSHTARGTITEMQNRGLHLLGHPASSPDLNLAEHPIGKIKYNLMNRRERRPTNERELRAAIEWE